MTSVQNHLQPLNGSKSILLIFILAFTVQSCTVFESIFGGKSGPKPPPPIEKRENPKPTEDPEKPTNIEQKTDGKENSTTGQDSNTPSTLDQKDSIHLALILPFDLDAVSATNQFSSASKNSFYLYQGMKQVIDQMNFSDKEVFIHVLDNRKDLTETLSITSQSPFPNVDLVVGPVYTKNVKAIQHFAARNTIPFISPLSSSQSLAVNNDYLISANATKETRYRLLLEFIQKEFINPNISVIAQPNQKEQTAQNLFVKVAQERGDSIQTKLSEGLEMFAVAQEALEEGRENIIILPVAKTKQGSLYLSRMLEFLQELTDDYKINVFALEEWNEDEKIAPIKYPNIQFYILDRYFVSQTDYKKLNTYEQIKSYNNGVKPHIYTLHGFDLMMYINQLINQYGKDFTTHLSDLEYNGIQTKFKFKPFSSNGISYFIENKHIHILKYTNGNYTPVN